MAEPYHEQGLSLEAQNTHRAITSLIEELEAVNWYNQRVDVCPDEELKAILAHNRDEEIEHACMTLEWLRRQIPKFDENLRLYLFTSGPVTAIEEGESEGEDKKASADDLGIGKNSK